jgi:protein-S-isoprenylcysteine O-methyltransferase Ste14
MKKRIEVKMLFKDEHDFSLFPKCFFLAAIIAVSLLAGYLMFKDVNGLAPWLRPYAINGNFTRRIILMFCLLFYVSRLIITVFVFLKRKMAWSEMLLVSSLMSFALFSFAKVGGSSNQPVGGLDYFSILLYLCGSWLNTTSEYTRYIWKNQDKNKGRLYTQGLFKYSIHINYFGDIIIFTGFALVTLRFSMLFIPLAMALNFVFFIIPRLDKYLANKYGEEFKEYAGRTKKLIPGIY